MVKFIPIGIEVHINGAGVGETIRLEVGVDGIRHGDGCVIGDMVLVVGDTPAIPAEGHAIGPEKGWNKKSIFFSKILHGRSPIIVETDEHHRGRNRGAGNRAVRHGVPGPIIGDTAEDIQEARFYCWHRTKRCRFSTCRE